MRIWKFVLEITGDQILSMPRDARVLCVQSQNSILALWAMCNEKNELEDRRFEIFGTGEGMPPIGLGRARVYIGTVQMGLGALVWHVFERREV